MVFNSAIFEKIRLKNSMQRTDLAELLGITDNYLYRIEKGLKQPSFKLARKIAEITRLPLEKLYESETPNEEDDHEQGYKRLFNIAEMIKKLERERHNRLKAEKYNLELERRVEHLLAVIQLYMQIGDVFSQDSSKVEKMKALQKIALKILNFRS